MRVALVSALYAPEFQGGATLVGRRLAAELHGLGHQTVVFSGRTTAEEPLGAIARGFVGHSPTYRVNVGGALLPWSRESYWNPVATDAFAAFLAETRVDVVHIHSLQGLGAGVVEAARASSVPVVVTMHDWWWMCPCLFRLSPGGGICPSRVRPEVCSGRTEIDFEARRTTLGAALTGVARIVVPSRFLRDSLVENGFARERIVVHENGVPGPVTGPPAVASNEGPTRLLYLGGGGNRAKGLDLLLEAASALDGDFVLDAYSVSEDEVRPWRDRLGTRLRWHDAFESERLDDVMRDADVVVVPSLMRESFSLVTREALVRGRPVVTSDCGGPEEVVRDGVNGLVVPSGSVDALRSVLDRLLREPGLVAALAAEANLEIVSPRAHAETTEALYREVLRETVRLPRAPLSRRLGGRRVLFLTGMDGAPLRYRAWNFVERLREAGVESSVLYHSDVRAREASRHAELIVLYRAPFSAMVANVVRDARRRGVPVLFSSDDFVFTPEDLAAAPALEHPDPQIVEGYRQSVEGHARCLAAADGFLGSTPELASAAAERGLPVYCLPNGLSRDTIALSERARVRAASAERNGSVRLGFASGTDTHDADLAMVAPALARTLRQFPETTLVLGGPVALPDELAPFAEQIERWPFVAWNELPERLATLDVNLAPLDTARPFNLGKSEVKLIEAAAVGVPTLASNAPAFVRASREGQTAMLCASETEWSIALGRLVTDPALRLSLGLAAMRDVRSRYDGDAQVDEFVDVLGEVFDRGSLGERELPDVISLEAGEGSVVAVEPGDAVFDRYQLAAESGEALRPGAEVEQRFTALRDGLQRVDVRVGTYARSNDHDVRVSLHDEDDSVLAEATLPAARFVDRRFVPVTLDRPYAESAGRSLTLRVSAPEARDGNEVLLWQAPSELGGLAVGGREREGRTLSFRAFGATEGALS